MSTPHPIYRSLVRLYPREFRLRYGDDLVQAFHDIVNDRGARAACARIALDLVLTVPRYHLERIMSEQRSNAALSISIGLLAVGGVAMTAVGALPGIAIIAVAVVFAVAQRSDLARSLRVSHPSPRRRRLLMAALSAGTLVACYLGFLATIDDEWNPMVVVFYVVGNIAMFAVLGFLIAGLLTYLPSFRGPTGPVAQPER